MSNPLYSDAGCPSQCWGDSSYATLEADVQCPSVCLSEYASPSAKIVCPSACNFSSNYVTLPNYYKYMNMPAETAARLYKPYSQLTDYQITNPRIVDFQGTVAPAQILSSTGIPTDATGLVKEMVKDRVPLTGMEAQALKENKGVIAQQVATDAQKVAEAAKKTAQVAVKAAQVAQSPQVQQAAAQAVQAAKTAVQAAKQTAQAAQQAPAQVAAPAAKVAQAAAQTAQATAQAAQQVPKAQPAAQKQSTQLAGQVQNLQKSLEQFYYM